MADSLRALLGTLRIPAIAAPMLRVSELDLALAASRAGIVGGFPTVNARTADRLDEWLSILDATQADGAAPSCPTLITRSPSLRGPLELICAHETRLVITSVGSPAPVVGPLHDAGTYVLADVGSVAHARRAAETGVDGLVLLTAGAGGQTGWLNPFAFVAAVREFFDGVLVVAGGMSDGSSLLGAQAAGFDLGYFGTKLIASHESSAADGYKHMLQASSMDDIMLTRAFTGLQTNMLRPSVEAAGIDPDHLDEHITPDLAGRLFGQPSDGPKRWQDIWSAGHSVSGVDQLEPVEAIVARVADEYAAARRRVHRLTAP